MYRVPCPQLGDGQLCKAEIIFTGCQAGTPHVEAVKVKTTVDLAAVSYDHTQRACIVTESFGSQIMSVGSYVSAGPVYISLLELKATSFGTTPGSCD